MEEYNGCSVPQYTGYGRVSFSRKGVQWGSLSTQVCVFRELALIGIVSNTICPNSLIPNGIGKNRRTYVSVGQVDTC